MPRHGRERGMVLISSLLLLLVVTILAIAMFRGFGVDEKIAGNTRDRELAMQAAQSAQLWAESWIKRTLTQSAVANSNGPSSQVLTLTNCTSIVADSAIQVCSNPLANPATLPWTSGVTYTLPTNGIASATKLSQQPVVYIYSIPSANSPYAYEVLAVGYGASPNTVALIDEIIQGKCLNC